MSAAPEPVATAEPFFVEGHGLVKRYGGVAAVDGVDFGVRHAEIVGLVGKNGAGKSTLIKLFAGAVHPDEGELSIDGERIVMHGPRDALTHGLSFVHQELSDVQNLSVAENVLLGLGYPRKLGAFVSWRALRRQAAEVLARIDAPIRPDALVGELSAVHQRLVMVAHALARKARLLVLDEPTAALTHDEIDHLHAVIRTLKQQGVAIVYVSHRLNEIFEITERVVVMRDGHVVTEAPTTELDQRQLISLITGGLETQTASERRRAQGVGAPPDSEELLRVEGLTAPGVVEDVSFTLHAGELLGLGGLVGSGRTELVRLIVGVDKRASGRIVVRGQEAPMRSVRGALRSKILLVPEERRTQGLVLDFSIRKNVTLATLPEHRAVPHVPVPSRRRERGSALAMIEQLGIRASGPEQPAAWLSGGNQQKVVLAKWLRRGGDIFVLDEPTLGVDVETKEEIYALMQRLTAEGKGVIFISSEFSELVGVCQRVLVLREGRLAGELVGDEVTEVAILERCYANEDDSTPSEDPVEIGANQVEDPASNDTSGT